MENELSGKFNIEIRRDEKDEEKVGGIILDFTNDEDAVAAFNALGGKYKISHFEMINGKDMHRIVVAIEGKRG